MIRLKIRYNYVVKNNIIFVRLSFRVPRELAEVIKKQLMQKYNTRNIVFTPYIDNANSQEDSVIIEL